MLLLASSLCLLTTACNDEFLEKYPVESQTEPTSFVTNENFKTYAWSLYNVFTDGNILRRVGTDGAYSSAKAYLSDVYAGYLTRKGTSDMNPYAFQNISNSASGNGWNFKYIRKVNLMLDNVDKNNKLTAAQKEHWRSVGYFFRAYYYMELVARFGDVPWIDKVLTEADTDYIYSKRMPRKQVTDILLDNLLFAEKNIVDDSKQMLTKAAVQALISRFSLFEGSWRKYHNLGDADKFFEECVRSSEALMVKYPTLNNNYGEELTSKLENMPGVIFFKEYRQDVLTHMMSHIERTSSHNIEMPQHIVNMYLCEDGKPASTSNAYEWGKTDKTIYSEFRNRDRRLLHTVTPPYELKDKNQTKWEYHSNPVFREYLDIMGVTKVNGTPGPGENKHKVLPLMNWGGSILNKVPNITTNQSYAYCSSRGGYYVYKHYQVWDNSVENRNTADAPIFKMNEVLLNYAEAKYELNQFDQSVADQSINKLRKRAMIAEMNVAAINGAFDPDRDASVDPVLWEIRRERIVELMGEGFGFYDIRRWKKADWFVNKQQYGMWAKRSEIGANGKLLNTETKLPDALLEEGYIYLFDDPVRNGKGWLDKYYLYQVPTNEIALNPNLKPNNPGWE
ncbi:MAG: RagB/SusD family nutrient uptake outer membrane protein [Bacteroidales bacterium]